MNFFKKVGYSITKIEKYPVMATEGTWRAIKYLAGLIIILAIVFSLGAVYNINKSVQNVANFIESDIPEFSFKEGSLKIDGEQPVVIEKEKSGFDKIIIETKEDITEEKINEYKQEIEDKGNGILFLKDQAIIINRAYNQESTYHYSDILSQAQIPTEFTKGDFLNYVRGNDMYGIYLGMFVMLFMYSFIWFLIDALWYIVILAALGYLVAVLLRVKMRYRAVFNMAVYSLTLSTLLNVVYNIVRIFTTFEVTYFQVMYLAVAFIYLIAAIFITRIDLMKTQEELTKIKEVQKEVKKQMDEENEKKKKEEKDKTKDNKDNKDKSKDETKDKETKKRKTKDNKDGEEGEPEGSNV